METIRYSETRKKGKGPIIGFLTFVVLGCAFIVFGTYIEEGDNIFNKNSQTHSLINIYGDVDIYSNYQTVGTSANVTEIKYEVKEKTYIDKENENMKCNISIPEISVEDRLLEDINSKIEKEYMDRFSSFKETLKDAENKYTYKVTYNMYENIIGDTRVISLTIWQRTVDDSTGKSVFDKIDIYNIDLLNKVDMSTEDVSKTLLGNDYKTKVKNAVKKYVVMNCKVDENTFIYAMSGLEKFYIKDGMLHIIINSAELVDKEYGVLDIQV